MGIRFNFDKNNARLSGDDVFSHPLLIPEFYVALRLAERAGEFEILEWLGDGACELEAAVMPSAERSVTDGNRMPASRSQTTYMRPRVFSKLTEILIPLETTSERRRSWWGGKVRDYTAYWIANRCPPMSVLVVAGSEKR